MRANKFSSNAGTFIYATINNKETQITVKKTEIYLLRFVLYKYEQKCIVLTTLHSYNYFSKA